MPANKFQNTNAQKPLVASNQQVQGNKGKGPANKAKTAKNHPKPPPKNKEEPAR